MRPQHPRLSTTASPWTGSVATEERLREQLQTLQRKLLHTITENEALSTRLAGLRSVCLELQEQLHLADVASNLDPAVQSHLVHLCTTAASYCEVEPQIDTLGRISSSGKLPDHDLACYATDAAFVASACGGMSGGVLLANPASGATDSLAAVGLACNGGLGVSPGQPGAGIGTGMSPCMSPALGARMGAGVRISAGLGSGFGEGGSARLAAGGRGGMAVAANAAREGGCDRNYTALMDSFVALKASYDLLIQQQQDPTLMEQQLLPLPHSAALSTAAGSVGESSPQLTAKMGMFIGARCSGSGDRDLRSRMMSGNGVASITSEQSAGGGNSGSSGAPQVPRMSLTGLMSALHTMPADADDGEDPEAAGSCALSADWRASSLGDVGSERTADREVERLAAHARALKASYDVLMLQRDHALSAAVAQKAAFDRTLAEAQEEAVQAAETAAVTKAQFDKFILDKAEEKAAFDLVLEKTAAEAAQQKAIADKALVDMGELQECAAATKAQFDKFVLDKTEEKAAFDAVLEKTAAEVAQQKAIADKALLDMGELQDTATATKAQFDKFVLDKTEEKAAFDAVLERTAAEASAQKAIADKALLDMGELQESAAATKAQFDKFVLDKTEEKAAFDAVLEKTAAEAAAQKAIADKALLDMSELQDTATATKAQFDKFVLDKTEEKAAFDAVLEKTAAEAAQQKAIADKALLDMSELQDTATATKAQFDKFVLDKTEEKAAFDAVLEKTAAEAAQQKAIADKALLDMSELQDTAAATKAQFDKFVLDKTEEKVAFDAVLEKTAAEAAAQKAIADKALLDMGELQESAAATKAQFDKFVLDKTEEKAAFDAVLEKTAAEAAAQKAIADKALLDMSELQDTATATKAQFDKFVLDKTEEKAAFDAVLEKTAAEAAQQKAIADKALLDMGELQDTAAATKAQFDKFVLDKTEEKAAFDAVLEKTAAEAAQQKAIADKALLDMGELQETATATKAQFDKFILDKTEEKAAFDNVLERTAAAAAAQKAIADKALLDMSELQECAAATKAQFDKFVLDKTEEKAAFDAVLEQTAAAAAQQKAIADKALLDMGELQASAEADKAEHDKALLDLAELQARTGPAGPRSAAATTKAQFDKFVLDKAEEKAAFDAVLEKTAAAAAQQKAIADKALLDMGELQESAAATKAQFDKFVLDKTEEKASFDAVLEKTAAEAAQQKAIADKALLDMGELQDTAAATKAQFDKFVLDKTEEKAAFDAVLEKTAAAAAQQKAIADKALLDMGELQESAATTKAQFDKFVLDKAEEKAAFDLVLEKTAADAAQQKAIADKALVDMGELQAAAEADKAEHDKALLDLDTAAATKAQFDKFVLDKTEEKAAFDAVLEKTAAAAAQQKAIADKALLDMGELQESAAATKAQFDKFVVDKTEEKATFDKMYTDVQVAASQQKAIADKALMDFSELKAAADVTKSQFDKFVLDKTEEKATFDATLEKVAAEAAQNKAVADKALVDMGELQETAAATKAQFDKYMNDKAEEKAVFDAALEKAAAEAVAQKAVADALRAEAETVAAQLAAERQTLDDLQAQNERLLKQQEVLQAELQMALSSYTPKAIIDAGTPADKILSMMTDLLDGSPPSIQDILLVQSAILEAHDIYQPVNLGKQLLQSSTLDNDVGMALLAQLGNGDEARMLTRASGSESSLTLRDFGTRENGAAASRGGVVRGHGGGSSSSSLEDAVAGAAAKWASLEGAIMAILAADAPFSDVRDNGGTGGAAAAADRAAAEGPAAAVMSRAASTVSRGLHARVRRRASVLSFGTPHAQSPHGISTGPGGMAGGLNSSGVGSVASGASGGPAAGSAAASMLEVCAPGLLAANPPAALERSNTMCTDATTDADEFPEQPVFTEFDIKPQMLARFLRRLEEGYRPNPYHSKTHAADVLQTFNVVIHRGGLSPGYVDPLSLMACYLAALVHDYEHGGLTNDYLINSGDLLAVRYNDRAPLENHHLAAAFTLLKKPEYAFLAHLPKADMDRLRKMVIELVLATDMKQHFAIMSHFTTVHRLGSANSVTPSLLSGTERRRSSSNASSINSLAHGGSGTNIEMDKIVIPLDENERMLSLQMALKCSDLGHVSAALPVHCRWVALLEEEFFRQGDMEKLHHLPVSPLFDRSKPGVTKSQVGFFDIVVIPLLNAFSRVFSNTKPLLTYTMRNYKYWSEIQKREQQAAAAAAGRK
ncbi:hypothetical protein GPECTOR_33g595 [Gonium pectorale]|uniref:Phosphodiesterase n=1 Tax=Gonium pectorale TaxID=33097 RepID=A0A150GD57_GONPE|nr:hypothetical protein GPECTOR_33g595 [Gonium pectorale]|eukprot:KXZ47713.1 hypothetical protein GPECTOR_33g595 [Gonium pectorale]